MKFNLMNAQIVDQLQLVTGGTRGSGRYRANEGWMGILLSNNQKVNFVWSSVRSPWMKLSPGTTTTKSVYEFSIGSMSTVRPYDHKSANWNDRFIESEFNRPSVSLFPAPFNITRRNVHNIPADRIAFEPRPVSYTVRKSSWKARKL